MNHVSVAASGARTRARFYGCLAHALGSLPTEETSRSLGDMAAQLGFRAQPSDIALRALKQEYMELFVLPNPRYVAPYESAHRIPAQGDPRPPEDARVHPSATAVRRFYRETGVLPGQDIPDHIANEVSFLAYAWSKEAQATPIEAQGWRHLRAEFRREHLLPWVGRLRERVSEQDRLGYYRLALRLLERLLREEEDADAETRWAGVGREAMVGAASA
jgi:TorA maturation chaperone TorD